MLWHGKYKSLVICIQILCVGDDKKWETMITHARTRDINEDKRMYTHKSSGEPQMRVVYDVAGELKGVIDESGFVCIDNLSADKKILSCL